MNRFLFFFLSLGLLFLLAGCQDNPPGQTDAGMQDSRGEVTSRSEVLADENITADATVEPTVEPVPEPEPIPEPAIEVLPEPEPTPEMTPEPELPPEPQVFCRAQKGSDVIQGVKGWTEIALNQSAKAVPMKACTAASIRFVAAKGMKIRVEIQGLPTTETLDVSVFNARRINKVAQDKALATKPSEKGKDYLVLEAVVAQSGEIGLVVDGRWNTTDTTLQIKLVCVDKCHLETTRFPTAFVHGFAGTDKYFGLLDYYYRVKDELTKKGYSVFMPRVQPVATSKSRVVPLKKQLQDFMKKTGARKLNLIAHSQGGLDSRHLISVEKWGDRIASLTTVATPHKGMPLPSSGLFPLLKEMSESNMKKFNQTYPNDKRVKYFSWAAISCGLVSFSCQRKNNGEVVDPLLIATYRSLQALRGDNDGVVPTKSMNWGTFLGTLTADHWDQIGQVADRNNKSFNHLKFYHNEVKRLRKLDF